MKTKMITTILALSGIWVFAQPVADLSETRPKNDVSVNLLGDASVISFSYERLIIAEPQFLLTGKLGLGYAKEDFFSFCLSDQCVESPIKTYFTLPHHLTANVGGKKGFIEFGVGGTVYPNGYIGYAIGGFRIQPLVAEKFMFRVFYQQKLYQANSADILFIPLGFSFGVALK